MPDPLDTHYKMVIKAITDGRVVPFFGAGVPYHRTCPDLPPGEGVPVDAPAATD